MTRVLAADRRGIAHPWRQHPGRTIGVAVAAVVAATWLTLVEVFWLPLRIGLVPVPVSVLAAVIGNLLLTSVAHRLSGSRLVALLPPVVWLVISVAATMRRPEGDLILVGGGTAGTVNLAYLLLGVVSGAFAAGRALAGRTPVRRPEDGAEVSRPPAGSGTGGAR